MRQVNFTYERTGCKYVRVNRRIALKAFKDGQMLVIYGDKINSNSPWYAPSFWSYVDDSDRIDKGDISDDVWTEYHFKRLENLFEHYNHMKPWYYLPEKVYEKYHK